jgi:diguanylate cyclase (GGDEF)-like protein
MQLSSASSPAGGRGARFLLFAALWALPPLHASAPEWRFWQAQQGLTDSYIGSISRDPSGAIWAVHGDVPAITRYDGNGFTAVKSPVFVYKQFDSLDGKNGWVVDHHGLHHLQDGKWDVIPKVDLTVASHLPRDSRAADLGASQALLLFPDHLARFAAQTRRLETVPLPEEFAEVGRFVTFKRAFDGTMWIVGQKGVVSFSYTSAGGLGHWEVFPLGDLPVSELRGAIACPDGELFAFGLSHGTNRGVALSLRRGRWEVVARQENRSESLLAWRDGSGDLWLADDNVLFRKRPTEPGNKWEKVDIENRVLSAKINDVMLKADGSFFVATTRGLALHVNLAWRAFERALDSRGRPVELRQHISSLMEDRRKRIWFLGQKTLFRYSGGIWDEYLLPKGTVIDSNQPISLGELEDGRILIRLESVPGLAIFDPDALRFSEVPCPAEYRPLMFYKRTDGRFLVVMAGAGSIPDALATLERGAIAKVMPVKERWNLNYARGILETGNGELWLGGSTGVWRLANGKYERIGSGDTDPLSGYSFLQEPGGQILIGGRKALFRWTGRRLELVAGQIEAARRLIRDRSGTVWAASSSGVFRGFSRERDWIPNDEADGLPTATTQSMIEASDGRIWVATSRGPAVYRPNTDLDAPRAIVSAEQNSSETTSSASFRIIFSGEDRWNQTPADLLLFSQRLDGRAWTPLAPGTIAAFHGIAAGKHDFEVLAADRQGNVARTPARFSFTVMAPWYRTGGFLALAAAGLTVIAYLAWVAICQVRQLQKMAARDSLTGAWNRRAIFELLSVEVARSQREARSLAVIMADLDGFKEINDRHGHPAGDLVLTESARRLQSCLRISDGMGRYGGEEFLIVMPGCDRQTAIRRAEELRRAVEGRAIPFGSGELKVTCSFGINWTPDGSCDRDQLLRFADAALYRAKRGGRNRIEMAEPAQTAWQDRTVDIVAS